MCQTELTHLFLRLGNTITIVVEIFHVLSSQDKDLIVDEEITQVCNRTGSLTLGLLQLTCSLTVVMRDVDKAHFWRLGQNIMPLPRVRWMSDVTSQLSFPDQTHIHLYTLGARPERS